MKTIFRILVFLFLAISVKAQIVNIPDANFKAKLIALGVDISGEGEIHEFEAALVNSLDIQNSNISNLIGIDYFTSLQTLYCNNNSITFLTLNSPSLQFLYCHNNQLPFLSLTNCPNLKTVLCHNNQLNSINVSNNTSLEVLWVNNNNLIALNTDNCTSLNELLCSNNHITTLNLTNNTNLVELSCDNNQLTSLNVSGLGYLSSINCTLNQLTTLDLSSCTNLNFLYCGANLLTSLNLNGLANLHTVSCGQNQLTDINVSSSINTLSAFNIGDNDFSSFLDLNGFSNLSQLYCLNNQITSLNITNCTNLVILSCSGNQLTSLNLGSELTIFSVLYCGFNQLATLDISNLTNLVTLDCSDNPLTTLFLKNGSSATELFFANTQNLEFICCDDFEINQVQDKVNQYGYTNCVVNSYCSFIPGGDYNTITGTVLFDSNNNGCDVNDAPQPNIKISINDGINQGSTFTNNSANYNFYTQTGSFDLTPSIENQSWFLFSPSSATIPFANNNNNTATQNFCITANGVHPDVEIVLMPIIPARPGFDAEYKIVYKNKGNQTLSGTVNLSFDDDKTDFVSAVPNPDNLAVNSLTWNYTNLLPFENRVIDLKLNVNSPVETPAVNIGDVLNFVTTINPIPGDELPLDNVFNFNQTVVGAYDPNNIECLEGDVVAPSYIGQYLHYGVNFENTGNFEAENVVVKIVIDPSKYNINTLQLLNTSHNSYTKITGNSIEFIFENIALESGGHGNILFKMQTVNSLVEGNSVAKRADIFFDYNAPIDTGIATTTFQVLSSSVFELDNTISIYPNPTNSIININCNNTIKSIQLYDIQGRLLQTQLINEVQTILDISEKTNGIYFVKITSDNGSKVEKIIKE